MKARPAVYVVALCAIALAAILGQRVARGAETNLILNGTLAKGSGEQPDDWRTEAWVNDPDAFHYTWIHPTDSVPGQLEVDAPKPNDARWMQSLNLDPGWYYLSVQVRTEGVGDKATGASISIMEDGAMSHDVRGTTPWREIGFYLKVGDRGGDIEIACRVGGYASLNTGRAFFRHASLTRVAGPAPHAERVFDLDAVRKEAASPPVGRPWTLVASFILLATAAVIGWRAFGEISPETASVAPQPGNGKPLTEPPKPERLAPRKRKSERKRKKARR